MWIKSFWTSSPGATSRKGCLASLTFWRRMLNLMSFFKTWFELLWQSGFCQHQHCHFSPFWFSSKLNYRNNFRKLAWSKFLSYHAGSFEEKVTLGELLVQRVPKCHSHICLVNIWSRNKSPINTAAGIDVSKLIADNPKAWVSGGVPELNEGAMFEQNIKCSICLSIKM